MTYLASTSGSNSRIRFPEAIRTVSGIQSRSLDSHVCSWQDKSESLVDDEADSDKFESLPASPNAEEPPSWEFKGKSTDNSLTVATIHLFFCS